MHGVNFHVCAGSRNEIPTHGRRRVRVQLEDGQTADAGHSRTGTSWTRSQMKHIEGFGFHASTRSWQSRQPFREQACAEEGVFAPPVVQHWHGRHFRGSFCIAGHWTCHFKHGDQRLGAHNAKPIASRGPPEKIIMTLPPRQRPSVSTHVVLPPPASRHGCRRRTASASVGPATVATAIAAVAVSLTLAVVAAVFFFRG